MRHERLCVCEYFGMCRATSVRVSWARGYSCLHLAERIPASAESKTHPSLKLSSVRSQAADGLTGTTSRAYASVL